MLIKENKKWFVVYVKSRSEKKVFKQLDDMGVESFLPLITRIKQWSDRKKKVSEPLFRSYVFVHIDPRDYINILQVYGVVRFVTFQKELASIPDNQIEAIKEFIKDTDLHDVNYDDIREGDLVIIKSGQFKDMTGRFVEIKGKHRIIIEIDVIGKSVPINVPRSNVILLREGDS